ncbi:MAG: 30S ribosomal protein S12 methylthiotransferase RimO [Bacteroidota bacterium]
MRAAKIKNVNVVTLGCSKNLVDSEWLMGKLNASGIAVVHDSDLLTDMAIINTCGFVSDAKQESVDTILRFAEAKKNNKIKKLFVMGCLSQRYRDELKNEIPEVDGWYGVADTDALLKSIGVSADSTPGGELLRMLTTPSHYAYLKIAEGCDRSCSFCAIPLIRGKNISRPQEEILDEARMLASRGVKELFVVAQDTTWYGLDIYKKRMLGSLLDALSQINGIEWIRLHYTFPAGFPDDVLEAINSHQNICKYIDIPLQHISDRILTSMKRVLGGKETRELVEHIRKVIPGVALRTTLITGYPGETEKEHKELLKFIEESRFERLGVFAYSAEEGTAAYELNDNISPAIKNRRLGEIMELQQSISEKNNAVFVGKTLKVVIDGAEGDYYIGRTEFDSPEIDNEVLILKKNKVLLPGTFYDVTITGNDVHDLFGKVN